MFCNRFFSRKFESTWSILIKNIKEESKEEENLFKNTINESKETYLFKIFKEIGNHLFKQNDYESAKDLYCIALILIPFNQNLERSLNFSNMAQCLIFLDYKPKSLIECINALKLQLKHDKSWYRKIFVSKKFKDYEAEPQASTWGNIGLATQLSSKFGNYEAEPTADSWEIIKAVITPKKERRVIAWPFVIRVGIAASIALLLGFGWLLYNNTENSLAEINTEKSQSVNSQELNKVNGQDLAKNKLSKISKGNAENEIGNSKVDVPKPTIIEQSNDLSGIASNGRIKKNQDLTVKILEKTSFENKVA
jgi:hypothetical protein